MPLCVRIRTHDGHWKSVIRPIVRTCSWISMVAGRLDDTLPLLYIISFVRGATHKKEHNRKMNSAHSSDFL